MAAFQIDPDRLMADLTALRAMGRSGTGVVRPAFSDSDIEARRWLARRMTEAGLAAVFDPVGSVYGLPPGEGPMILLGSHSDTQPEGGWLDGAYGVIAGLEVARASLAAGGPRVAAVSFQDEEGRFGPLTGSQFCCGFLSLEEAEGFTDLDGLAFGEARGRMAELATAEAVPASRFAAYLEAHIEQGPVLDTAGEAIGVVEAIVGTRELLVSFTGQQNHAGTTPMTLRRDAFKGLADFAMRLDAALAAVVQPATVWTIGHVALHPNASSIVPGRVSFTVQGRDADPARLDRMVAIFRDIAAEVAAARDLQVTFDATSVLPPTAMDKAMVELMAGAAERCAPGRWRRMPSGALHDATNLSQVLPTAMVFVPSIGGVSHAFEEDTAHADLVLGAQVLADCVTAWGEEQG